MAAESLSSETQHASVLFSALLNLVPFNQYVSEETLLEAASGNKLPLRKGSNTTSGHVPPKFEKYQPRAWMSTGSRLEEAMKREEALFEAQKKSRPDNKVKKAEEQNTLSREELRTRLQNKINELKQQKKRNMKDDGAQSFSPNKRRRKPSANHDGAASGTAKIIKAKEGDILPSSAASNGGKSLSSVLANSSQSLDFGSFIVDEKDVVGKGSKFAATPNQAGSKKKRLLNSIKKLEKQKMKMDSIKDDSMKSKFQNKISMQNALEKLKGKKVQDNLAALKKAQKKVKKKKVDSKKIWEKRKKE